MTDRDWKGLVDEHGRPLSSTPVELEPPDRASGEHTGAEQAHTPVGHRAFRGAVTIAELLGLLVVWQWSHGLAIGTIVGLAAWELWPRYRRWRIVFPILSLAVAVLVGRVGERLLPTPHEPVTHGWLRPGTAPSPKEGACFPSGGVGIYLGDSGAGSLNKDAERYCVIEIGGRHLLDVHRNGGAITVSAQIFDESGLVARIADNEFQSNRSQEPLRMETPDEHTLIVRDWLGDVLFRVAYLNPEALYVTGRFYVPGYTPILVDDAGVHMVADRHLVGICLGSTGTGCAFSWEETSVPQPR